MPSRILLVGGTGVVGSRVAALLRRHHPDLALVIASRSKEKGDALAAKLGHAEGAIVRTGDADPLATVNGRIDAVLGLVHDNDDNLLRSAIRRGIPYADITRGNAALSRAFVTAALEAPRAPILFASNWMAGVPAIVAVNEARTFGEVDRIDLSILFDRNDETGPDSADAGGGLAQAMTVREGGAWRTVGPMSSPATVTFPSGRTRTVFRMNMADVMTIAQATGAKDVAVRIGLDSDAAAKSMRFLLKTGLWGLIQALPSSKSPAHNPKAKGALHELVIEIAGKRDGKPASRRIAILDPAGQAHLTALGAVHATRTILGLNGTPPRPGIAVPETTPNADALLQLLQSEGVQIG
jgi:saccharopine dehydrogenase-like NADP-dependent oxidoreductase